MLKITQAETPKQIAEIRSLFREYENSLGLDLCFQGFEDELRGLPGKYATPNGRLLLSHDDDQINGCVALRRLDDSICEMKRLFVRSEFRGRRIGVELIDRVIADARSIGYRRMRLDTYPSRMAQAVSLYERYGFSPIPAYYDNPYEGVLFMELEL